MVFFANTCKIGFYHSGCQFPVCSRNSSYTTSREACRCSAFVHEYMPCLGTEYGLVSARHALQGNHVASCPIEYEQRFAGTDILSDFCYGGVGPFVVTITSGMVSVCICYSCHD